jgi:hypothetical protein
LLSLSDHHHPAQPAVEFVAMGCARDSVQVHDGRCVQWSHNRRPTGKKSCGQ